MRRFFAFCIAFIMLCMTSVYAELPYEAAWNRILDANTSYDKHGRVKAVVFDYKALHGSQTFSSLVRYFSSFDTDSLVTEEDRLSFWLNIYNISAAKLVLDNYPVLSIKDIGTVSASTWDRPVINVGGNYYSLSDIRTKIFSLTSNPVVLFGIADTSLSGPDLRTESYTSAKVWDQLEDQKHTFLMNETKGLKVKKGTRELKVSKLFLWHASLFKKADGVKAMVESELEQQYPDFRVTYLKYNWLLNDK